MDLSVVIPVCSWKQIVEDRDSWESEEKWYSPPKAGAAEFGQRDSVFKEKWYKRIAACLRSVTRWSVLCSILARQTRLPLW